MNVIPEHIAVGICTGKPVCGDGGCGVALVVTGITLTCGVSEAVNGAIRDYVFKNSKDVEAADVDAKIGNHQCIQVVA